MTLLEPTARHRDADLIDLLGAVAVASPRSTWRCRAGARACATGDRSALGDTRPRWTRFGPVDAVCRRDSPPRIAQVIALPAQRKPVCWNEAELLHGCITAVKESALKAYPSHEPTAVVIGAAGGRSRH